MRISNGFNAVLEKTALSSGSEELEEAFFRSRRKRAKFPGLSPVAQADNLLRCIRHEDSD